MSLDDVSRIETHVINSLVSMVMKLSESTFRPMYLKVSLQVVKRCSAFIKVLLLRYRFHF